MKSGTNKIISCPYCLQWSTISIEPYLDAVDIAGNTDIEIRCSNCKRAVDVHIEMVPTYKVHVKQPA